MKDDLQPLLQLLSERSLVLLLWRGRLRLTRLGWPLLWKQIGPPSQRRDNSPSFDIDALPPGHETSRQDFSGVTVRLGIRQWTPYVSENPGFPSPVSAQNHCDAPALTVYAWRAGKSSILPDAQSKSLS